MLPQGPFSLSSLAVNAVLALAIAAAAWVLWVLLQQYILPDKGGFSGPTPLPVVGNLLQLDRFINFQHDHATEKTYGSMFRLWVMSQRLIVASEPSVVKTILTENWDRAHVLFMDYVGAGYPDGLFTVTPNPVWKAQRKYMNPGFAYSKLKSAIPIMQRHGEALHGMLCEAAASGSTVLLDEVFVRFTFDVICELVLGKHFNCLQHPDDNVLYATFMAWNHRMQEALDEKSVEVMYYKQFRQLGVEFHYDRCAAAMRRFVEDYIDAFRAEYVRHGDDATYEGAVLKGSILHMLFQVEDPHRPGQPLDTKIIASQAVTLLFAGHVRPRNVIASFCFRVSCLDALRCCHAPAFLIPSHLLPPPPPPPPLCPAPVTLGHHCSLHVINGGRSDAAATAAATAAGRMQRFPWQQQTVSHG